VRAEQSQEMADSGDPSHRHHMDAGAAEDLATPPCQDLHRGLVAPAFDENDSLQAAGRGQPVGPAWR
jgi:hypothetical protein